MKTPFEKAFSIPNVKAGFKKCGIYPFNPDVVPAARMTPSTVHKSLLSFQIHLHQIRNRQVAFQGDRQMY